MNGVTLQLKKEMTRHAVGSSKLFGSPDVWADFEWPAIIDSDNCYDLDFVAQINCRDFSEFDTNGDLPSHGMLYFFYDFTACPESTEDTNAARVIYYNGNIDTLNPLILVDEDGFDSAIAFPHPIFFSSTTAQKRSKLQMCYENEEAEGYTVLLRINSFSAQNGKIRFNDKGALLFLIRPEKLKRGDFSDIRVKHIYK
ncbi:MAG: DUF1963 domain-containing protein [Clostridia bacterium]|nr:DUF1963 domain-containing protein [Clostridia bacterium]